MGETINNYKQMNGEIGVVFINGAGLNSSIWYGLKQKMTNPALTIEFPNRKSNGTENINLAFEDYTNSAIAEIKKWKKDSFIIVGHSIGACVGIKVAEEFRNELKGFVAIASVIPESGQSFASALPFPQRLILPILLSLFGTKPPKKSIEAELCNDLTPEMTSKIVTEFTAEAKALYTKKITFELPDTKRLYIKLSNDKSMPPDLQNEMARRFKATKIET